MTPTPRRASPVDLQTRPVPTSRPAREVFEEIVRELELADIPTAVGDAEVIVAHILGITRIEVQEGGAEGRSFSPGQLDTVAEFVTRRKAREPLQHLTGKALFRELTLAVGPGVFVPRRETEFVAELAIRALKAQPSPHPIAVDLCMGAGAIALSMATEVPNATVYGVELDPAGFAWAKRNFETIAPHNAFPFNGDVADAFPELDGLVDVIGTNPPWLPIGVPPATPEVALWDPPVTWFGGDEDGMHVVRTVSRTGIRLGRPGASLAMEHGISQAPLVRSILAADGWVDIRSHVDPRGRERVTTATHP